MSTNLHIDDIGNLIFRDGKLGLCVSYQYATPPHYGGGRLGALSPYAVEQVNHYYAYGGIIGNLSSNEGLQEFKFGDKKLDRTYGLDLYDFEARQYDAIAPCFTSIDPLAEKYYSISPYAYCAGDPVNFIDPTGCEFDSASMQYVNMFESETNNIIQKNEATINKLQNKKQSVFRKKKIERLHRQNSGLKTALEELNVLKESNQMYSITIKPELNQTTAHVAGGYTKNEEGRSTMRSGVFEISVASESAFVMLAHELKHAYQFETGNYSILSINVKFGFYDLQDEVEAYARGALYGGSKSLQRDYSGLNDGPLDVNSVVINNREFLPWLSNRDRAEAYAKQCQGAFRYGNETFNYFEPR